jgi:hypothetical protein
MIKVGTFVKITNLDKIYKFVDAKGRAILPSSYKSIANHFDNLQVISNDEGNYVLNVIANKLYFVTNVDENDIEIVNTYWTIDLNNGKAIQIDKPTKPMYILGLVFKTEKEAIDFYNSKKEIYK